MSQEHTAAAPGGGEEDMDSIDKAVNRYVKTHDDYDDNQASSPDSDGSKAPGLHSITVIMRVLI